MLSACCFVVAMYVCAQMCLGDGTQIMRCNLIIYRPALSVPLVATTKASETRESKRGGECACVTYV